MSDVILRLRQALASREKRRVSSAGRVAAAVLVPLYLRDGEYHIIFVKRSQDSSQHRGEIAFPGGVCEARDGCPEATALRECLEEIGLGREGVEVLGELDDVVTLSSGYAITPFVGFIAWPYSFKADQREIEAILEVPVSALLGKEQTEAREIRGQRIVSYRYRYGDKVIWGATARILKQFLDILAEAVAGRDG